MFDRKNSSCRKGRNVGPRGLKRSSRNTSRGHCPRHPHSPKSLEHGCRAASTLKSALVITEDENPGRERETRFRTFAKLSSNISTIVTRLLQKNFQWEKIFQELTLIYVTPMLLHLSDVRSESEVRTSELVSHAQKDLGILNLRPPPLSAGEESWLFSHFKKLWPFSPLCLSKTGKI